MTFSIVAKCQQTGQFGVGAATGVPAVGKLVSYAWPRGGAVATQARVNPYLGIDGIRLLRDGMSASQAMEQLGDADPNVEARQFAMVDSAGDAAAWTGRECIDWAGHEIHAGFSVQGNRLAGPFVLKEAAEAFSESEELPLADRLMAALRAGDKVGGDRKGEISATIYVVDTEEYPLWDIRVDDHPDPVAELHRLHAVFSKQLLPHILQMPTRKNPAGEAGEGYV